MMKNKNRGGRKKKHIYFRAEISATTFPNKEII